MEEGEARTSRGTPPLASAAAFSRSSRLKTATSSRPSPATPPSEAERWERTEASKTTAGSAGRVGGGRGARGGRGGGGGEGGGAAVVAAAAAAAGGGGGGGGGGEGGEGEATEDEASPAAAVAVAVGAGGGTTGAGGGGPAGTAALDVDDGPASVAIDPDVVIASALFSAAVATTPPATPSPRSLPVNSSNLVVEALKLANRMGVPSSAGDKTLPFTLRTQVVDGSAMGGERASAAAATMADSGCMGVRRTVTRRPSTATEKDDAIF